MKVDLILARAWIFPKISLGFRYIYLEMWVVFQW